MGIQIVQRKHVNICMRRQADMYAYTYYTAFFRAYRKNTHARTYIKITHNMEGTHARAHARTHTHTHTHTYTHTNMLTWHMHGQLNAGRLRMATLPTPCQVLYAQDMWVPLCNVDGVYILPGIPKLFQVRLRA
jgi:hypothetical protein